MYLQNCGIVMKCFKGLLAQFKFIPHELVFDLSRIQS